MNSTANTSTPVEAQIELSIIEGSRVTGGAEDTPTPDSKTSPAEKVTVYEPRKMIARRLLQKAQIEFYLGIFSFYHGLTSRIVADIEKYQLLEVTNIINDEAVIAAEEPDERELEILQAKERVRYRHVAIREKWIKQFGDDGQGYSPSVFTPGSKFESLWHKSSLSSDMMRVIRNSFAHNYQVPGEITHFKWLYEKYATASPAFKALTKKLQEALDDPENWFEVRLSFELEDLLGPECPEYSKDTPETEASWATEVVEYEERRRMMMEAMGEEEENEEEEGTATWGEEGEAEPVVEGEGQGEDSEEITESQPPKSRGCMNLTLGQVMEFALKAKSIRRVANMVGQQLWEMQGDMDPDEWIATGIHYHHAPDQESEWDDIPDPGLERPIPREAQAPESDTTSASDGGWSEDAGW